MENNENKNAALNKPFRNDYKVLGSSAFALSMNVFLSLLAASCFVTQTFGGQSAKIAPLFSSLLIGLVFLEEQAGLHLHVTYQQQAQAFHTDSITERRMRKFAVDYSPFSCLLVIVWWLLRVFLFDCYAICDSIVRHGSGNAGWCFCMLLPTDVWRFQCGSVGGRRTQIFASPCLHIVAEHSVRVMSCGVLSSG